MGQIIQDGVTVKYKKDMRWSTTVKPGDEMFGYTVVSILGHLVSEDSDGRRHYSQEKEQSSHSYVDIRHDVCGTVTTVRMDRWHDKNNKRCETCDAKARAQRASLYQETFSVPHLALLSEAAPVPALEVAPQPVLLPTIVWEYIAECLDQVDTDKLPDSELRAYSRLQRFKKYAMA